MMRLQRVGRKNDPAYRIVVTDKRTSVSSDSHVDRIGSYNPKLGTVILDKEKAAHWLAQGVQPSGTMHNMLVSQGVLNAKKINVLPRKSPIVDEAAIKKAAEEAAAKKAAEEKAAAEAAAAAEESVVEEVPETPAEEPVVAVTEEVKA